MSELYENMIKQYPILFCQRNKSMQETCMCWGIEAGDGWYKPLNELCSYLEILNNTFYPKYKVRIQADQVKEKYGELRFYYSIIVDPGFFLKSIMNIANFINDKIKKHAKFQIEKKIIFPAVKNKIKYEINEKIYEDNKDNENFFKENDKFYQLIDSYEPEKFEYISKNHKLLYKINKLFYHLHFNIKHNVKANKKQKEIGNLLDKISDALIHKCENDCWNVCEWCGADGGFQGENIVTTSGWISRICKECYKKSMEKQNQKLSE
ncbi:MAG: hypothetical protein IKP65_01565 [Alphaproteobacteria bacterium]|nr:hypothetical protein [Alphaproteobacteria bacterium]